MLKKREAQMCPWRLRLCLVPSTTLAGRRYLINIWGRINEDSLGVRTLWRLLDNHKEIRHFNCVFHERVRSFMLMSLYYHIFQILQCQWSAHETSMQVLWWGTLRHYKYSLLWIDKHGTFKWFNLIFFPSGEQCLHLKTWLRGWGDGWVNG